MSVITKKRNKIPRNKKKNWRLTDITQVEEHLEDKRLDERIGGPVSEKLNSELFFVDTTVPKEEPPVPVKRPRREVKPLRCHAILELDSKVKPLRTSQAAKIENVLKRKLGKGNNLAVPTRHSKREKWKKRNETLKANWRVKRNDLWASKKEPEEEPIDKYHNEVTKKTIPKPPKNWLEKPSGLQAVEPALPGQSYNPAFDDHQALLEKAYSVEEAKYKEKNRLQRALFDFFPTEAPSEKTYIEEMSAGLFEDPKADNDAEEDSEKLNINPPVRRERKKTEKQRRKEKLRKEQEKKRLCTKAEKVHKEQFTRIKSIKKAVNRLQVSQKEKQRRRADLVEKNKDKPKRLGRHKYREPELQVKYSNQLVGCLRHLKPSGELLHDRYKSLQKRNIIEHSGVTKKHIGFRKKKKYVEKRGHREIKA